MKKELAALALCVIFSGLAPLPEQAMTLEGTVEKTETAKKKSFWERLFAPEPEGRVGIRINTAGNIEYVHPGSPAESAGLLAKDTVVSVDGRQHAVEDISGEPGSTVHLEVRRGDDQFPVDVERVDCHLIQR
jgi:S1-C subfamily serine protease